MDRFLANSHYVAGRIARYYNRQATVLYPPVDTQFFTPGNAPAAAYFLVVSALVPYKRLELAIDAAKRLGAPLKIVGAGPDRERLRARAGGDVEFLGQVDDQALRDAYRQAHAVLLPGEEDFGIVPVEAMACGRPVIALARGGATETVVDRSTGLLVEHATPDGFADAMAESLRTPWDSAAIRAHAERFSREQFESSLEAILAETLSSERGC